MIKPSLSVQENLSTGYRWVIVEQVNCHVTEIMTNLVDRVDGEILVGGGHTKVFEIDPIKAGEYRLSVVYTRAWDKDQPGDHAITLEGSK